MVENYKVVLTPLFRVDITVCVCVCVYIGIYRYNIYIYRLPIVYFLRYFLDFMKPVHFPHAI